MDIYREKIKEFKAEFDKVNLALQEANEKKNLIGSQCKSAIDNIDLEKYIELKPQLDSINTYSDILTLKRDKLNDNITTFTNRIRILK
jgi:hypothetical protein